MPPAYFLEVSGGITYRLMLMTGRLVLWLSVGFSVAGFGQEEIDAVAAGKKTFELHGCMVCHGVTKGDAAVHTGPSLYGLFLNDARDREVVGPDGAKRMQKADKDYLRNSVRRSADALAVAEAGATKGNAYPAAMPSYSPQVVSDADVENLWHYLRTLADAGQAGPAEVKVRVEAQARPRNILDIPNEVLVTKRARVFRAPVRGSSGRALHVGLPSGMNYTFDPRVLSVRAIWGGGFLNLTRERNGRSEPGTDRGHDSRNFIQGGGILQPLSQAGVPIDFEFKEPDVLDDSAVERWMWDDRDEAALLAAVDAEFVGHKLDPKSGEPTFLFRVGKNKLSQMVTFSDGRLEITLSGKLVAAQGFKVASEGLEDLTVTAGTLRDGVWSLDPAAGPTYKFSARLKEGLMARPLPDRDEDWTPQPLVRDPAPRGNQPAKLPAGYSLENWESPKDIFGRNQLFEATGIAVAKNGTIVVVTRTAGIWRIRDNQWTQFAEGTYEALGVLIEDDKGDKLVVMQKPELTRMTDANGDGRAETFQTLCDDYGFHGNYHEFAHGPVRDAKGNFYFALNLCHGGSDRANWRAGGPFMGSMGGYRGWAIQVTPDGKFVPFANGLRSPAGLGVAPDGRVWYTENQGEYVGSSKVIELEQGKFYGHPSGLVSLPGGMKPDSPELNYDLWKDKTAKCAVWLPHGKLANSPGSPAWDLTNGKFGPFGKQMFVGDQTLSTLLRVSIEKVGDVEQGSVTLFARGLVSGVMRPCFLPDGSLLLGQTGRGWGASGGKEDGLQRIVFDPKVLPADIHHVSSAKSGFTVHFTQPLASSLTGADLAGKINVRSWFYLDSVQYGSPELEQRDDKIETIDLSTDRKSATITLTGFGQGDKWLDRIYAIKINQTKQLFPEASAWDELESFFTLRAIPK
jgi:hypothetical protein